MNRLIISTFRRLWKSKIFWLGMSAMCVFGIIVTYARKRDGDILGAEYGTPDGILFIGATYFLITAAVFVTLFIGDEHASGTWRNKITAGYSRTEIYLTYLFVTTVASLLMHLSYIVAVFGLSKVWLGAAQIPPEVTTVFFYCSLFTVIAINSLMVMLCMLIHSRSATIVVCMLLALALMMGGLYIYQLLSAPEILTGPPSIINGQLVYPQSSPNPKYLTGVKRAFFQFLHDFLPGGQMITIGMTEQLPANVWVLPIYSIVFSLICSLSGILVFRRKDLK